MIHDRFNPSPAGADALIAGFYAISRQGRTAIPVRIWYGAPIDGEGVELDRSPRWQIQIGNDLLDMEPLRVGSLWIGDLSDIWPACARDPIDETEWRFRMDRAAWAAQYDANDAYAEFGKRIDPFTCSLP